MSPNTEPTPRARRRGSVFVGEFSAPAVLTVDFADATVEGSIGEDPARPGVPFRIGGVVTDGATGETRDIERRPDSSEDFVIALGWTEIPGEPTTFDAGAGAFGGGNVRLDRFSGGGRQTVYTRMSGQWGGRLSAAAAPNGEPRLAAGTFGVEGETPGGTRHVFVGSFIAGNAAPDVVDRERFGASDVAAAFDRVLAGSDRAIRAGAGGIDSGAGKPANLAALEAHVFREAADPEAEGFIRVGAGTFSLFSTDAYDFRMGGWAGSSMFFVGLDAACSTAPGGCPAHSWSVGAAAGANPAVSGTWTGTVAAYSPQYPSGFRDRVTGDAALTVEIAGASATAGLVFSGLASRLSSSAVSRRYPDMAWSDIALEDGAFSAEGLGGRFYGPSAAEAGGVFARNGWEGAFGVARR